MAVRMATDRFQSPSTPPTDFRGLIDRILAYVHHEPDRSYRLTVGTDSLPSADGRVALVTAVVLQRVGSGGIYLWRREVQRAVTLRDRMLAEALASIALGVQLRDDARLQPLLVRTMEVHVDIGENGPSRDMIAEVVGMVVAYGFVVRTKPEAYAASTVADRYTVPAYGLAD